MLLTEYLKERRRVQELEANDLARQQEIAAPNAELKDQRILIQKVNDKVEETRSAPQTVANEQEICGCNSGVCVKHPKVGRRLAQIPLQVRSVAVVLWATRDASHSKAATVLRLTPRLSAPRLTALRIK
jgi:hypothetical protein